MSQSLENGPKLRFWANFDIIMLIMRKQDFFSKIGLRHFSPLTSEQLHAKNLRDPMVGSMRTFVKDRQTDRQTGGILKDQTVGPLSRLLVVYVMTNLIFLLSKT